MVGDENLWIDFTCVHTLAPSNIARRDPVDSAEKRKESKYSSMVDKQEGLIKFVPFVTDTYGRLGPEAAAFIDKLATFAQTAGRADAEVGRNAPRARRLWMVAMFAEFSNKYSPALSERPRCTKCHRRKADSLLITPAFLSSRAIRRLE